MSYYKNAFEMLMSAGVPSWYIRLYLIDTLVYSSRVYVYYNPHDVEAESGWYATTGISITSTPADRNRKCYGELKSQGFPSWEEYKALFNGDEYDSSIDFYRAYEGHKEEWFEARAKESRINYAE